MQYDFLVGTDPGYLSPNCIYTLESCSNMMSGIWTNLPDQTGLRGSGATEMLEDTNEPATSSYRVRVETAE